MICAFCGGQVLERHDPRVGGCNNVVHELGDCCAQLQSENATLKADLAALREVEREKVAAWILSFGFATGHGDTIEDLLSEAGTQIQELRAAQKEMK